MTDMGSAARFAMHFDAAPDTIDELGHVNNIVWVQWIQTIATAHWRAAATAAIQRDYVWVVVRHEIDYHRALAPGGGVTGRTWVDSIPQGAKLARWVEFTSIGEGSAKVIHVRARTTWALLSRATMRPVRVTAAMLAPFHLAPTSPAPIQART